MKITFYGCCNVAGADFEEEHELDDSEFEGMSDEDIDKYLSEYAHDVATDYYAVEGWYEKAEDGEED